VSSSRTSAAGVLAGAAALGGMMIAGSVTPRFVAFAQEKARAEFEVASVKSGNPDDRRRLVGSLGPGRFDAINASLRMLISFAYDVREYQVSGGPGWLSLAEFNIEAKPPRTASFPANTLGPPPFLREMVQSMLADRFRLTVHRETHEQHIYELTIAKSGSKLTEVTQPPEKGPQGVGMKGRGTLFGSYAPAGMLAQVLSGMLQSPVIDKTGLTGKYNFEMKWTPDSGPGEAPEDRADVPAADAAGPTMFTAMKEQLGLELKSARGPGETIVVDHAEKPDAN
jgi:bla regulator protein blaR1